MLGLLSSAGVMWLLEVWDPNVGWELADGLTPEITYRYAIGGKDPTKCQSRIHP